jgi:hypothetical protein
MIIPDVETPVTCPLKIAVESADHGTKTQDRSEPIREPSDQGEIYLS